MATTIGKSKKELPKAKRFMLSRKVRRQYFREYKNENGKRELDLPLFMFWLFFLVFAVAGVFTGMVAADALVREGHGMLGVFAAIIAPFITAWAVHLFLDLMEGLPLTVGGTVVWTAAWFMYGTGSTLWLAITAFLEALSMAMLTLRYSYY